MPSVIIGKLGGAAKKVTVVWRHEPGQTPYTASDFKIYDKESR